MLEQDVGIMLELDVGKTLKGNMHHKYDVGLKDAFYIIDLAAEIYF